MQQFLNGSLSKMFARNRPTTNADPHPGNRTPGCNANVTSQMTSSIDVSPKYRCEITIVHPSASETANADLIIRSDELTLRRNMGAPSWSSGFETSSSVLSLSFQSSGPPSPDLESTFHLTPRPMADSRSGPPDDDGGAWSIDGDRYPEMVPTTRRSSIDTVTSLTTRDAVNVAPWLRDLNENASESTRMSDSVTFGNDRPGSANGFEEQSCGSSGAPRTINEISTSLAANIARLGRDRRSVDEAFGKARSEEKIKTRELANIRRQVMDARRQILIATLRRLSGELSDQCRRLQAAYDTVLANHWRQLNAVQEHQSS